MPVLSSLHNPSDADAHLSPLFILLLASTQERNYVFTAESHPIPVPGLSYAPSVAPAMFTDPNCGFDTGTQLCFHHGGPSHSCVEQVS